MWSCLGHSSCPTQTQRETGKQVTPSPHPDPTACREFCLDDIQGHVYTTWRVTNPPFGTISIHGSTAIWGHCMWIHVLAEPAQVPQLPTAMVLTATDGKLDPGSSQVPLFLRDLSAHPIKVHTKVIVDKVALAIQVPLVVLPMETSEESAHCPQKGWILEKLNCQGLEEWSEVEQEKAR